MFITKSKLLFAVLLISLISSIIVTDSFAQLDRQFGFDIHPSKLLENSEGIIQIYTVENNKMTPVKIEGLKVTSSDNKVIKIDSIEKTTNNFITEIKISSLNPGSANIAIAAPEYNSVEIPVTVFTNNKLPTKILMKIAPDDFPVDGPTRGFVTVELATTDDFPVKATEDIVISLNTPNQDVVEIVDDELTISAGEYFTAGQFRIKGSGDAIIFAETENMRKISKLLHVREASGPLTVKLYAFPSTLNSLSNSEGYVIAQLQDSDGIPLKATKDINVSLQVTNPDASLNVSSDFEELIFSSKKFKIEEGSYWAYTSFSPRPDLEKFTTTPTVNYEITLSTENYVVDGTNVNVVHEEALLGEGPVILEPVPVLTTGGTELIGVAHLFSDIPVMANNDLKIPIESSNAKTTKGTTVTIKQGKNSALVFAKTGSVIPEDPLFLYVTDSSGTSTVSAIAEGPLEDDLKLNVEPMVSKILSNEEFPILAYLIESEGDDSSSSSFDDADEDGRIGVTQFIQDGVLTFSANDIINVDPVPFNQGQDYVVIDGFANDLGKTTLAAQAIGFDATMAADVLSTDPSQLFISYPETIIPNSIGLITIQTLDIGNNPAYTKNPIELKLVSNNNIIKLPENVIIRENDYNVSFDFESLGIGKSEISVLANDIPLTKFSIEVVELNTELTLNAPKYAKHDETYKAVLSVNYPNFNLPLDEFQVEWKVEGGTIQAADIVTDKEGSAIIVIQPNDVDEIKISANVMSGLIEKSVEGTTLVVKPKPVEILSENVTEPEPVEESNNLLDSNLLVIIGIVAGAVVGIFIFLKKTDKLDDIKEKITDMKDNLPDFRK